jgi:hypothetical protein
MHVRGWLKGHNKIHWFIVTKIKIVLNQYIIMLFEFGWKHTIVTPFGTFLGLVL